MVPPLTFPLVDVIPARLRCSAHRWAVYSCVADQLALAMDATAPGTYRPRGTSSLQRLFLAHLSEILRRYDSEFAARLGKYRREHIAKAVERFLDCGDYSKGIARIKCTNADCKSEYFRPFSCKVFYLCPSSETHSPFRRVHERAAPAAPSSPPDRLHPLGRATAPTFPRCSVFSSATTGDSTGRSASSSIG